MREPSHSVFIQSDPEQRSAIVQPYWCCHSTQDNTAGGGRVSVSHTHTHSGYSSQIVTDSPAGDFLLHRKHSSFLLRKYVVGSVT